MFFDISFALMILYLLHNHWYVLFSSFFFLIMHVFKRINTQAFLKWLVLFRHCSPSRMHILELTGDRFSSLFCHYLIFVFIECLSIVYRQSVYKGYSTDCLKLVLLSYNIINFVKERIIFFSRRIKDFLHLCLLRFVVSERIIQCSF